MIYIVRHLPILQKRKLNRLLFLLFILFSGTFKMCIRKNSLKLIFFIFIYRPENEIFFIYSPYIELVQTKIIHFFSFVFFFLIFFLFDFFFSVFFFCCYYTFCISIVFREKKKRKPLKIKTNQK